MADGGAFRYKYSLAKGAVTREPLAPSYVLRLAESKRWRSVEEKRVVELMGVAAPAGLVPSFISLTSATAKLTPQTRTATIATFIAAATLGGIGGYYLAHSDARDFDNPTFVQTMMDSNNWMPFARLAETCNLSSNVRRDPRCAGFTAYAFDECNKHGLRGGGHGAGTCYGYKILMPN